MCMGGTLRVRMKISYFQEPQPALSIHLPFYSIISVTSGNNVVTGLFLWLRGNNVFPILAGYLLLIWKWGH